MLHRIRTECVPLDHFEDVTHNITMVLQAMHFYTRFKGLNFGVISWEEIRSAGNVNIVETQNQILSGLQ